MEYINFNLAVPVGTYLELENLAFKNHISKNEIIINAIFSHLASENKDFNPIKNAGFNKRYNKF